MKAKHVAICAALLLASAELAQADELSFYSSDGPIDLHVGESGRVFGHYQQDTGAQRPGRIVGHMQPDRSIEGLWLQPASDHPCGYAREGTYAWGHFIIGHAWGHHPYGSWGYCDEAPNRDWQIRPR